MNMLAAGVAALAMTVSSAHAAVVGFTSSDVNYASWAAAAGMVTTNIDFDNLDVGASYTGGNGIQNGAGPGQGNTFSVPLSSGEGLNTASNYLFVASPDGSSDVTFTFAAKVSAAGLSVIDYFGAPVSDNVLTISAFDGANGTGTLLGSFDSARFNFQTNNVYFMGLVSDSANIGSLVFRRNSDNAGDNVGLDNLVSAGGGTIAVPEPSVWALMIGGFGMAGAMLRRRRAVAA